MEKKKQKRNVEVFKKKYLGKVGGIIEWVVNLSGLILSVVSFVKNEIEIGWKIVLGLVIFNSIFLISISIYETLIYKKSKKIEDKIGNSLKASKSLNDKISFYFKFLIATFDDLTIRMQRSNEKYYSSKDLAEKIQCEYDVKEGSVAENIASLSSNIDDDYKKEMIDLFNRFLSNVTVKLKDTLETYLREKGCSLEVSISVKQFIKKNNTPKTIDDFGVITIFRDAETYSKNKRETKRKIYSINKNTDFLHCLYYPCYLKNNINPNDTTYNNEHEGFSEFYNCTIVVPIRRDYKDMMHFFGYLTCDILNDDLSRNNLLDDKMAEVMSTTANIIGMFYDKIDEYWRYVLNSGFVNIIYKKEEESRIVIYDANEKAE